MSKRQEVRLVLGILKKALRQKKVKYKDIAEALGVSLPTVKRMMIGEDVSFDRLCQLCELIDVSIFDLMKLAQHEIETPFEFSDEQNEYLSLNPHLVAYFFSLQKRGMTPEDIEKKFGISKESTAYYLRELESLSLLERLPGGRIKLLVRETGFSTWDDSTPLGRIYAEHIFDAMKEKVLSHLESPKKGFLDTGSKFLTEADYESLKTDWNQLVEKYQQRSSFNAAGSGLDAKAVTYLLAMDVWRDPFFTEVKDLSMVRNEKKTPKREGKR